MNPDRTNPIQSRRKSASGIKRLFAFCAIGLLGAWLVGCAGRKYNDEVVAMIQNGVTTEVQLVAWFGPATARTRYSDGAQLLTWELTGGTGSPGKLQVRLDPDGRVTSYSGAAHKRY